MTDDARRGLSRREFLLAAGAGTLAACATGPIRKEPSAELLGLAPTADGKLYLGVETGGMREAIERIVPQIDDLSWLSRGDPVMLKVACNSPNPHPAVTSPDAVRAMVSFLRDRGAGEILVADQAGVEHVRRTRTDRRSSTRELMRKNGLLAAIEDAGAKPVFFDDLAWDEFFQPDSDFADGWQGKVWLPRPLLDVPHVIYLPRLSTHAVAGYTAATKIAVGWLRDDSRMHLHRDGDRFYERIAEINHFRPLRERLRFSLTLSPRALLNIGPDFGGEYRFRDFLALGSTRLVDHDLMAAALLPWLDAHRTSFYDIYSPYPKHVNYWNKGFVKDTWGKEEAGRYVDLVPPRYEQGLAHDAVLSRLCAVQGYRPRKIAVLGPRPSLPKGLQAHLAAFDGGVFVV